MPTKDELKAKLFEAVRAYMAEGCRIGGNHSHEWAVSVRVAIQLARMKCAYDWEEDGFTVDAEYNQKGTEGAWKGQLKPDLIVHKRGHAGSANNWLACEIKLHNNHPLAAVPERDLIKLNRCKDEFQYRVALWVSIPRKPNADEPVYAEIIPGQPINIVPMP